MDDAIVVPPSLLLCEADMNIEDKCHETRKRSEKKHDEAGKLSQRSHRMTLEHRRERFSIIELIFEISRETSEPFDVSHIEDHRTNYFLAFFAKLRVLFVKSTTTVEFFSFELALDPADTAVPRLEIFQLGCGVLRR